MARRAKKKARLCKDEDRISLLPDELIHQIMSFMDTRLSVRTSLFSKRWKFVWTTSPFLIFNGSDKLYPEKLAYYKTLKNVFSGRNHNYRILTLDLHPPNGLTVRKLVKYVNYATLHAVERMNIRSHRHCSLSAFSSDSLTELKLTMDFDNDDVKESDCWNLPKLTTLILKSYTYCEIPESCLICLRSLTTLVLNQCKLPEFLSLPALKSLCLDSCSLPGNVWDFPALITLQVTEVSFSEELSEYILALVSLRNLAIDFGEYNIGCCDISSSQLVNLKIRANLNSTAKASQGKIVVWAQRLCNFTAVGIFPITFKGSDQLKEVNINFWDRTIYRSRRKPSWVLKKHRDLFNMMFSQLGSAEILSVDLVTLQALSEISDILDQSNSPFLNMKYLKLPFGCEESYISSSVRKYLLGGSPTATIVKT